MEGYICINGNKTLLTPEQIKELGFCEKPVPVQGLALVRDSLRDGTFLERFKLCDVVEDFGYHFEIIGYRHDRIVDAPTSAKIRRASGSVTRASGAVTGTVATRAARARPTAATS